jgi:peptidoglycan/xylan/chitin deacetylase (PgdA/CDA1 family)
VSTRSGHRFLVCIHDATPAHAHETEMMLRDLAPLVGRRLSCAVVPDWHGEWPLAAHPEYCQLLRDSSEELLLHGYVHRRSSGFGPATLLAEGSDEMNGLGLDETRRTLERGQRVFTDVFGRPARGFLAPAWQRGHVRLGVGESPLQGLATYVLGFLSLESGGGRRIPLATWTWDCGRWGWLGHAGHATGWLLQSLHRGVPVLAIHPRDLQRGFWPQILRLTRRLLERGYEPVTPEALLEGANPGGRRC